jgi:cytochrome c oxidase subunit 2
MSGLRKASVSVLGAPLLCGCAGMQSSLDSHGDHAGLIAVLSWVMFIGATLISLGVVGVTAYAIFGDRDRRARFLDRRLIIGGGILFPTATLTALLIYSLILANRLVEVTADDNPLRIEVIGEQWWWRVHYLDEQGQRVFATANEVRVPVGQPVEFILTTADVIHSFWIPSLGGKLDMIPGHVNRLRLKADKAGVLRGQCAEYCGGAHALMAFFAVVETPERFASWYGTQQASAHQPADPFLIKGRDVFLSSGCGGCHAVRGTGAAGVIGPDLTHIGSRRSIGAGLYPINAGTLAGWIVDSQHLKPENRMPSFNVFTGEELRALAAYLESLK